MKPHAHSSMEKKSTFLTIMLPVAALFLFVAFPSLTMADQKADFKRVRAALSSGDLLEAQSLLENIIDNYAGRTELKARYLLGQVLYNRAEYGDAAAEFSRIVSADPEWEYADRATYGLAMAQCGMVDYSGAIRTLETLVASYPESETLPNALYWLGEATYRRGDYDDALTKFNRFLSGEYFSHGLAEYALDSVAWCLEQKGRYGEAIESRQEFLQKFPDSPLKINAEFCLATDYLKTGSRRKAVQHYLAAESANPQSPLSEQALLRAGLITADIGEPREAIPILEELLAKNPKLMNLKPAKKTLGNCYLRNGQYQKSEDIFVSLLKEAADEAEKRPVAFQLALAQVGLGKFDEGASHISLAMGDNARGPLADSCALVLASCLLNLDQPAEAAEKLRSFLDTAPSSERSPELVFALAGTLILTQRFEESEPLLAELSADKKNIARWPQIPYYDGLCLFHASRFASASEKFGQFAEAGKPPKLSPLASFLRANSFLKDGKLAEAIGCYTAFLKQWPDDPMAVSALYQSGLTHLALGKYENASSSLSRVIDDNPSAAIVVPARYFLAVAQMRGRELDRAIKLFRFLLTNTPQFELADRAALVCGLAEFESGNYAGAEEVLKGIPSKFPQTKLADSAMFFSAAAQMRQGLKGAASMEFQKLAVLFPESPLAAESTMRAAVCEEEMNRLKNALALYRRAMAMETGVSPGVRDDALYGTAWVEMRAADAEAATADFGKLTRESPQSTLVEQAYFWLGRLSYASGQWENARKNLLNLITTFPESELADDALFFAARSAHLSMDWNAAIELFGQLCRRYPQSPLVEQAKVEAAECMIDADRADVAVGKFKEFIEIQVQSPLRPLVLYDMGKALQRASKFEEAIEQFRASAGGETNELAARSHFAIAECLAELDRNSEAIAELISIVQGGFPAGWAERAQLQMARLLERDGQVREARHVYATVADTYGDDAAGMVALKAIRRLDSDKRISTAP